MNLNGILDFLRRKTEKQGILLLRITTGIIYIWFGALKFFPANSPAEGIVSETLEVISFGLLNGRIPVFTLGVLEILIGFCFLLNKLNYAVPLMYLQMLGTILPLFLFIDKTWVTFPLVPTLLGQYIIKNLVFIAVAIILGASERGAKLITDTQVAKQAEKTEKEKENSK